MCKLEDGSQEGNNKKGISNGWTEGLINATANLWRTFLSWTSCNIDCMWSTDALECIAIKEKKGAIVRHRGIEAMHAFASNRICCLPIVSPFRQ